MNCYAAGERTMMERSRPLRQAMFEPRLNGLTRWKVTADHLSLVSLVVGLAFSPLFLFGFHVAALVALTLHVLADALDGPLARFQRRESAAGGLTDSLVDQVVGSVATLTLMADGTAGVFAGGLYVFVYTVVLFLSLARNALRIPYAWLVRPRFFIYAWIAVELYLLPGSLDFVLWTSTALLTLKGVTGYLRMKTRLDSVG